MKVISPATVGQMVHFVPEDSHHCRAGIVTRLWPQGVGATFAVLDPWGSESSRGDGVYSLKHRGKTWHRPEECEEG